MYLLYYIIHTHAYIYTHDYAVLGYRWKWGRSKKFSLVASTESWLSAWPDVHFVFEYVVVIEHAEVVTLHRCQHHFHLFPRGCETSPSKLKRGKNTGNARFHPLSGGQYINNCIAVYIMLCHNAVEGISCNIRDSFLLSVLVYNKVYSLFLNIS